MNYKCSLAMNLPILPEILRKSHCNTISSSRLSLNGYNMYFNLDPDSCQPANSIHGVGIYVSKEYPLLIISSQAPVFRNILGFQFLLKVVIIYLLDVSIKVHLLCCQVVLIPSVSFSS